MPTLPGAETFHARVGFGAVRPQTTAVARGTAGAKIFWELWSRDSLPVKYSDLGARLQKSHHPELEDQPLLEWGVAHSHGEKGEFECRASVDVIFGIGHELSKYGVDDIELEQIVASAASVSSFSQGQRSFKVFFIDTSNAPGAWATGNFSIRSTTLSVLKKAGLSSLMMSNIYSSEEFWAKMGNQRFLHRDEKGNLTSFEMCYRYLCGWEVGVSFTQFIRTQDEVTYFCINYPARAREKLEAFLRQHPEYAYREFFIDAVAADDCFKGWQLAIGERRESLLYHERKYANDREIDFNLATRQLHELSKDWYTIEQDFWAYNSNLEFLKKSFDMYLSTLQESSLAWVVDTFSNTGESFEVLQSQAESLSRWIGVYRERTTIQINLLFNLAIQRESHTSTQIARSTAKVAEQTQRDSASMITIAAVTMAFLPGTFICAILSTTFFNFGVDGLNVSRQWWILPATTIPLMIVVFAVWLGWQYVRFGSIRDERNAESEKYSVVNSAKGERNA